MIEDFCICHRCQRHRWQAFSCEYRREFSKKKSKQPSWYTQGIGGNWFMKKTRSRKSRDTVPLREAAIKVLLADKKMGGESEADNEYLYEFESRIEKAKEIV